MLLKFQALHKFSSCIPYPAPLGKGILLSCLWPRLMPAASFNHLWDQCFCSILLGTPNNYSRRSTCSHFVHKATIKSPEGGHWKRYFIFKGFKTLHNCCILSSSLPLTPCFISVFQATSVTNSGMLWQIAFLLQYMCAIILVEYILWYIHAANIRYLTSAPGLQGGSD